MNMTFGGFLLMTVQRLQLGARAWTLNMQALRRVLG